MPLFKIDKNILHMQKPTNFSIEKEIQNLIEKNLETVFNCRFVASEFSTGSDHAGRIDTLALSEDNNPVIIEYKKEVSSQLVNQSLFYLSWLSDHRGDFQIAANQALGNDLKIEWSDIRVICMAPAYKKYDIHAVQMMGANIELWQYRLFEDNSLYLEEVFRKSTSLSAKNIEVANGKNPIMVAAGKKAALTRATGEYSFEKHLEKGNAEVKAIIQELRDFILNIDDTIEEIPKKFYVAYRVAQNFVCVEVQKSKILLYLKIDASDLKSIPPIGRDVKDIGHYGTGDFEITIKSLKDLEVGKEYIQMSYDKIGG